MTAQSLLLGHLETSVCKASDLILWSDCHFLQKRSGKTKSGSRSERMGDAMEPPKEDFSVGPLSVLSESVKKNCQVSLLRPCRDIAGGARALQLEGW